jgi:PAS domain S-box-containing protein
MTSQHVAEKRARDLSSGLFARLSRLSRFQIRLVAILLLVIVGSLDDVTQAELAFTAFYLIPIVLVSWWDGKSTGVVVSVVAAAVNYLADIPGTHNQLLAVALWNSFSRLVIFFGTVWTVDWIHKAQHARVQVEADKYTRLVEASIEGVIVLDTEGRVNYANARAALMLDRVPEQLEGLPYAVLVKDDLSRERIELLRSTSPTQQRGTVEIQFERGSGGVLWTLVSASSFPAATGDDDAVLLLISDISERKQAEEKLRRQFRQISAFHHLSTALVATMQKDWRLELALKTVLEVTKFDAGLIYVARGSELFIQQHLGLLQTKPEVLDKWQLGRGVTGDVWRSGIARFLTDVKNDASFDAVVREKENVKGFASVPLIAGGKIIGILNLIRRTPHVFSTDEQSMLQTFGGQIGVALENARLYEAARTGEQQIRQLSISMIRIQEEERKRLARELHDGLAQLLTMLRVNAELALESIGGAHPDAEKRIREVITLVGEAESEAKQVAYDLRPVVLDDFGLPAAIQVLASSFQRRTGILVELHLPSKEVRFDSIVETTLYRIIQELLANVSKHAKATRVTIQLLVRNKVLALTVSDNGTGFIVRDVLTKVQNGYHHGLRNMRERAESLQGMFRAESSPGRGAEFVVEIPSSLSDMDSEKEGIP